MMTPEVRPSMAGEPVSCGQVVGQAHHQHALCADALDEARLEVVQLGPEERLALGPRGDDVRHRRALEEQQAVLVERHQLTELVDGRLDDLVEVEAGGRPRRDVVEQLRLARRLLLAGEQRGVVDGERRRVADRRRRVELRLREGPLGAALDQLHGADDAVLDDQGQRGPALELVVLVDLAHGRREPRVAQRPDHRRPLGLDHLAGDGRVGQRQALTHPRLVHLAVAHAHQRVQLVALDDGDLALVDADALAQPPRGREERRLQVEAAGQLQRRLAHQRHPPQVVVQLPVQGGVGDGLARDLRQADRDLLPREPARLAVHQRDEADDVAVADQRYVEALAVAPLAGLLDLVRGRGGVGQDVGAADRPPLLHGLEERAAVRPAGTARRRGPRPSPRRWRRGSRPRRRPGGRRRRGRRPRPPGCAARRCAGRRPRRASRRTPCPSPRAAAGRGCRPRGAPPASPSRTIRPAGGRRCG